METMTTTKTSSVTKTKIAVAVGLAALSAAAAFGFLPLSRLPQPTLNGGKSLALTPPLHPLTSPATHPSTTPHTLPIITVSPDYPAGGSSQVIMVATGTTLGRVKVMNNSTSTVKMTSFFFVDKGTLASSKYVMYKLTYSDQNSANYFANTAQTSTVGVYFGSLAGGGVQIDGGAYRYFSVVVQAMGNAKAGDAWQLNLPTNDVQFSAREVDLGYDFNGNGNLSDTITGYAQGSATLGTIVKQ